ncbi:hypothetical protein [Lacticaseibacillus sp. N501-2]|uniref:hypothetical protein n=1 Tax=Lacticaseibacillus salsurae TaxID=3367729 RepID=UPI0038B3DABF
MQYGIIGASYQQGTLSVFHAGIDEEPMPSFVTATQKALRLLVSELAISNLADIHHLHDTIVDFLQDGSTDVQALDDATGDTLTFSEFDDDHFVLNVMDQTEKFQLHIEVTPIGGSHAA